MRPFGQWSRCSPHSLTCPLNKSKLLLRFCLGMPLPNIQARPWKGSSNISSSHGLVWEDRMAAASNWSFGMSEIGTDFFYFCLFCVLLSFFWPEMGQKVFFLVWFQTPFSILHRLICNQKKGAKLYSLFFLTAISYRGLRNVFFLLQPFIYLSYSIWTFLSFFLFICV